MELTPIELNEEKIHSYFSNILDGLEMMSRELKESVRKKEHQDDFVSESQHQIIRNILLETQIKTAAVTGMMTLVEDGPNFHTEFVMAMQGNTEEDMSKAAIGRAMQLYQRYNIDVINKVEIIIPNILKVKENKSPIDIAISRSKVINAKDYFKVVSQDIKPVVKFIPEFFKNAAFYSYDIEFANSKAGFPALQSPKVPVTDERTEMLLKYIQKQTEVPAGRFTIITHGINPLDSRCIHISNTYIQGVHFYRCEIKRDSWVAGRGILLGFMNLVKEYHVVGEAVYQSMKREDKRKMSLFAKLILKLANRVGEYDKDFTKEDRKSLEEFYYDFKPWSKIIDVGGYGDPIQAIKVFVEKYGYPTTGFDGKLRFE